MNPPPLKIAIGSVSDIKTNGTLLGLQILNRPELPVKTVKASSLQHEQPVGFDETLAGAFHRALGAQAQEPDSIGLGIESGIFRSGSVTIDFAVVVAVAPDGRQVVTTTQGTQFPEDCALAAEKRGFDKTTVGSVIAEKLGGDSGDPHATLSGGRITRASLLAPAIAAALAPLLDSK